MQPSPPHYGWYQPPKPGCIPLRPLDAGNVIGGAASAIRRNARLVLPISVGFAVVQAAIQLAITLSLRHRLFSFQVREHVDGSYGYSRNLSSAGAQWALSGISTVLNLLITAALTGLITLVVADDAIGRRPNLTYIWGRVRPRLPRILGVMLIVAVLQTIGLALCLAPGIWLWGIWALTVPAMIIEDLAVGPALKRSRGLVRGMFWRVWGIRALCWLIASLPGGIAAGVILGVGMAQANLLDADHAFDYTLGAGYLIAMAIVSAIATTFTAPFLAAADTLLYIDARMRKEGLADSLIRAAQSPG